MVHNFDNYWESADVEQQSKKFDHIWSLVPDDFDSVLDVGGGIGALNISLEHHHKSTVGYMTIDSSQKSIDVAQRRGIKAQCVNFDKEPLPFENDSFDLVVLSDVIEHMQNPWALLAEASRVSRKYVYVMGPNFAYWKCRLDALRGNPIRSMVVNANGGLVNKKGSKASHIYYITYNNLILWAQKAGLRPARSRVFWYRRYAPFRWVLEYAFRNFGERYEIVFKKVSQPEKDPNFNYYNY